MRMCHSPRARPSIFICSASSFHSSRLVCPWFRRIARVVSQVYAFQGVAWPYSPDRELQDYLRRRISWLAASDRQLMATDADLQQSSERQSRKIQEKLKRVKATFEWAPSVVPRRTTLQCLGSGHPHASSRLVNASFCRATLTRWKAFSRNTFDPLRPELKSKTSSMTFLFFKQTVSPPFGLQLLFLNQQNCLFFVHVRFIIFNKDTFNVFIRMHVTMCRLRVTTTVNYEHASKGTKIPGGSQH